MPSAIVSIKTYIIVFVALMGLLVLTVGVSFLNLGSFGVAASLAIAILKALLIALFFMEVRYNKPITWLFAGAALAWLVILLALTMNDYVSRSWSGDRWEKGLGGSNHVEFARPR